MFHSRNSQVLTAFFSHLGSQPHSQAFTHSFSHSLTPSLTHSLSFPYSDSFTQVTPTSHALTHSAHPPPLRPSLTPAPHFTAPHSPRKLFENLLNFPAATSCVGWVSCHAKVYLEEVADGVRKSGGLSGGVPLAPSLDSIITVFLFSALISCWFLLGCCLGLIGLLFSLVFSRLSVFFCSFHLISTCWCPLHTK